MQHIWTIYYENAHPVKDDQLKLMKRKILEIALLTFSLGKSQIQKQIMMGINGLHLFSILKSLRLLRAIFQRDHLGLLQCKNPVYITCFSRALDTDKKGFSGEIFHTIRMNIV